MTARPSPSTALRDYPIAIIPGIDSVGGQPIQSKGVGCRFHPFATGSPNTWVPKFTVRLSTSSRRLIIRLFDRQAVPDHGPRKNEQIRITPIRLIGAEGEQLGLVPTFEALQKAREAGLDLVEVAADERPPVCRILDYGKLRFATSQKGNKSSKVRQQKLKEIRFGPKRTTTTWTPRSTRRANSSNTMTRFRSRSPSAAAKCSTRKKAGRVLDSVLAKLATVGHLERTADHGWKEMTALIMPNKSAAKPKPKIKPEEKKSPVAVPVPMPTV